MAKRRLTYVPILKTKQGERWALSQLKAASKGSLTPLMEFHGHNKKQLGDHVESVCESLQAAWGVDQRFYIDIVWLNGDLGSPAVVDAVFQAADECGLQAVPVVRPSYDDASLDQLRAVIAGNGRGCLLRVTRDVLKNTPKLIDAVVEAVDASPDNVDFLLDYRHHAMSLASDISKIPHLEKWRSLIAASGVFPSSLASIPLHEWQNIPRNDWLSWKSGAAKVPRKPIYADYVMRAPGAPADFGSPSVNLRYALADSWLVQMGGKHQEGAAPEMHDMCQQLIEIDEYSGPDFSRGDELISLVADEDSGEGPGGPTQWLQWCVSHHIEFVVSQLGGAAA